MPTTPPCVSEWNSWSSRASGLNLKMLPSPITSRPVSRLNTVVLVGMVVLVPCRCSPKYRLPSRAKVTLLRLRSEKLRTGFCTPSGPISTTAGVPCANAHSVPSGAKFRPPILCVVPLV